MPVNNASHGGKATAAASAHSSTQQLHAPGLISRSHSTERLQYDIRTAIPRLVWASLCLRERRQSPAAVAIKGSIVPQ